MRYFYAKGCKATISTENEYLIVVINYSNCDILMVKRNKCRWNLEANRSRRKLEAIHEDGKLIWKQIVTQAKGPDFDFDTDPKTNPTSTSRGKTSAPVMNVSMAESGVDNLKETLADFEEETHTNRICHFRTLKLQTRFLNLLFED